MAKTNEEFIAFDPRVMQERRNASDHTVIALYCRSGNEMGEFILGTDRAPTLTGLRRKLKKRGASENVQILETPVTAIGMGEDPCRLTRRAEFVCNAETCRYADKDPHPQDPTGREYCHAYEQPGRDAFIRHMYQGEPTARVDALCNAIAAERGHPQMPVPHRAQHAATVASPEALLAAHTLMQHYRHG